MVIKNNSEIIPGWNIRYKEVSNGVYEITLIDSFGRKVENKGVDFDAILNDCERAVFNIEKQMNKNLGQFLFLFFQLKLPNKSAIKFTNDSFNSWTIQKDDKRLFFDNSWMIFQKWDNNDWSGEQFIKESDLSFEKLTQISKAFL